MGAEEERGEAMGQVAFNPDRHEFTDSRGPVPGVTTVLRVTGLYSDYHFAGAHHKYRGQAVHHGCAILDMGGEPELAPVSDPELAKAGEDITSGYWPAFSSWKAATRFQGACWECPIVSEEDRYGGVFDVVGVFETAPNELIEVDLKSGVLPEMVPVQLAAYHRLVLKGTAVDEYHPGWQWVKEAVRSGLPVRRIAVRLGKDGKWKQYSQTKLGHSYDDRMFDTAWRSSLNTYHMRAMYKMIRD